MPVTLPLEFGSVPLGVHYGRFGVNYSLGCLLPVGSILQSYRVLELFYDVFFNYLRYLPYFGRHIRVSCVIYFECVLLRLHHV